VRIEARARAHIHTPADPRILRVVLACCVLCVCVCVCVWWWWGGVRVQGLGFRTPHCPGLCVERERDSSTITPRRPRLLWTLSLSLSISLSLSLSRVKGLGLRVVPACVCVLRAVSSPAQACPVSKPQEYTHACGCTRCTRGAPSPPPASGAHTARRVQGRVSG